MKPILRPHNLQSKSKIGNLILETPMHCSEVKVFNFRSCLMFDQLLFRYYQGLVQDLGYYVLYQNSVKFRKMYLFEVPFSLNPTGVFNFLFLQE